MMENKPSREDRDEQIEEISRRHIEQSIRMKKHPELWPHMPSDRYGFPTAKSISRDRSSTVLTTTTLPAATARAIPQTNLNRRNGARQVRQKSVQRSVPSNSVPSKFKPQSQTTATAAATTTTTSALGIKARRLPQPTLNTVPAGESIRPTEPVRITSSKDARPNAAHSKSIPKPSARVDSREQQPESQLKHQHAYDFKYPDSGIEIDSSLADSHDSPNENHNQQVKATVECGREDNNLRLEKARQRLEELARQEAEDRRQRQLIVDNILSKFNPNSQALS